MSVLPSVKNIKVAGTMVTKPVNIRVAGTWKPIQNVTGVLYVTPGSGTYSIGNTVTLVIRENSYSTQVNSLEAKITYPTSILQFVSTNETGTPFDTPAFQSTGGSGTVTVTLSKAAGSVSGDQLVSTVSFTVLTAGTANIAFDPVSGIAELGDEANICNEYLGAQFITQ